MVKYMQDNNCKEEDHSQFIMMTLGLWIFGLSEFIQFMIHRISIQFKNHFCKFRTIPE